MSNSIIGEIYFLLHSFFMGVFITFLYDTFRVFRRIIKHGSLWIAIEDLLFWTASCFLIFHMFYKENNGIIRWFSIVGVLIGMILYGKILGRLYIKYISKWLLKLFALLEKAAIWILRPLCIILKKVYCISGKTNRKCITLGKVFKKWLTARLKMVKMMLCKR